MSTKQLLGRTRRARRNLALKLILERRFAPELTRYFNRIVADFRTFYIATGQPIGSTSFSDDTVSLLKKQYLRVSKAFSNEMRLSLLPEKSLNTKQDDENEFSDIIDAGILLFIQRSLPERSANLDETTTNDINDSIQKAQQDLAAEGLTATNLAVGTAAARILKRKVDGRKTTINMSETQFMAESTKAIEATVIASEGAIDIANIITAIVTGVIFLDKSWAAILDGKTRSNGFDHAEPDGQKVKLTEPFIVSGEKLMFPGDSSLGASIGNKANCRCSALYSLPGTIPG